jgi:thiol-disulfide isomerase/thioredoxin
MKKNMKMIWSNRLKSLALILIMSLSLIACKPLIETGLFEGWFNQGVGLAEGDYAPADHWQGQWRVINIWAEWCKPCWQEIPELNQFFALQGSNDVKLLGFNFDELEQVELKALKEKMLIQFPVLAQWPEDWVKPDIKGLPATIIMSPSNQVTKVLWGPQSLISLHQALEEEKFARNEE